MPEATLPQLVSQFDCALIPRAWPADPFLQQQDFVFRQHDIAAFAPPSLASKGSNAELERAKSNTVAQMRNAAFAGRNPVIAVLLIVAYFALPLLLVVNRPSAFVASSMTFEYGISHQMLRPLTRAALRHRKTASMKGD